jgi:hypothetical protein
MILGATAILNIAVPILMVVPARPPPLSTAAIIKPGDW